MQPRIARTFFALCAVALLVPAVAIAQAADDWKFTASLYGYLPSIGGKTAFPGSGGASSVTVDAQTIIENLKFTFMGSIEARRGPWGGLSDVLYVDMGDAKSGSRDLSIGNAGLPAGASASVDLDVKGWVWTLGATYRAVSRPAYSLDVLGGARMLDLKQSMKWTLSGNVGPIPVVDRAGSRATDLQNWDLVLGVKGRAAFGAGNQWFVPYYLDIGTGESRFTWQAVTGLGYSFGWGDIVGAWRYIGYDMKSGKAVERLDFNGPGLAAVFRW